MNKKLNMAIAGVMLSATVVNAGSGVVEAATRCQTYDGWITASSLFIKSDAAVSSQRVGSLFKGDRITIIGQKDDYVKIAFGSRLDKIGYVPKQYVSSKPMNNNDRSIKKVMYVNANDLNMRNAASTVARKLGKIYKGYSVEIDDSVSEINHGGYVWVKCKAIINPNGEKVIRRFYVAKKFLSESPVVGQQNNVPDLKPEINKPVVTPDCNDTVVKPETNTQVVTPEVETDKTEVELKPIVTDESVELVADGDVTDVHGKVLLTLKKGDKVTLAGESVGTDKESIKLNNGSYGIIKKSMVDADYHSHDEFEYGRPCNSSNLGQSMGLVTTIANKNLVVLNSDCKYYSNVVNVPVGSEITVATDRYNPETGNVEIAYKYLNTKGDTIQGQGFISISQFI